MADVICHHGPREGLADVEFRTLEWAEWHDGLRLTAPMGHVPPAEFEMHFDRGEPNLRPRPSPD